MLQLEPAVIQLTFQAKKPGMCGGGCSSSAGVHTLLCVQHGHSVSAGQLQLLWHLCSKAFDQGCCQLKSMVTFF